MKICFILPGFTRLPIGGYKIVYQYAKYLNDNYEDLQVTLIHVEHSAEFPNKFHDVKSRFKQFIKKALIQLKIINHKSIKWADTDGLEMKFYTKFNKKRMPTSDIYIATSWQTAFMVEELKKYKDAVGIYFIQAYEIWDGSKQQVDTAWKLPLQKIVIASWLQELGLSLGVHTYLVTNFIEKSEYYLEKKIEKRNMVVSMLYHEGAMKGGNVGIETLKLVKKAIPSVKIKVFSVYKKPNDLPDSFEYYYRAQSDTLRHEIYNESSVFLLPSKAEGWGLTATEAMLCGAALVSTKNGGVNDFGFNGETALLNDVDDVNGLANSIIKLLNEKSLRIKLAKKGYEYVSKLTIDRSGSQLYDVLKGRYLGKIEDEK